MPIDSKIAHIPPTHIVVGERQRADTNVSDLIESIKQYGILVPLIVREATCSDCNGTDSTCVQCDGTGKEVRLIAGHRRLACAVELVLETVPVLFYPAKHETEAKVIELLENVHRRDLPWRDHATAIGQLHTELASDTWTVADTAQLLNLEPKWVARILTVYSSLNVPAVADSTTLMHAINTLQKISERQAASLAEDLLRTPSAPAQLDFGDLPQDDPILDGDENPSQAPSEVADHHGGDRVHNLGPSPTSITVRAALRAPAILSTPIIVADFVQWSASYSGPKFNLIHCDFGAADFEALIEPFAANFDRFASYSAHVMFWCNFDQYEAAKTKLRSAGLHVLNRPLIWSKSDVRTSSSSLHPSYDACLLAFRGNRQLGKGGNDHYHAPSESSPIHPAQKPEPMLVHFFSMLVDNVTDFLDPACGSGTALRAAERLNARTTLGLEINPEYATVANAATLAARNKRYAAERLSEERS